MDWEVQKCQNYWKHHVVRRKLGSGRFGRVYLCENKDSRQIVALKQFRELDSYSKQEIEILSVISKANLCSALGINEIGHVAMIPSVKTDKLLLSVELELVEGIDLWQLIANQLIDQSHVYRLFLSAVQAVRLLHEAGLVHRDIKLENLVWNEAKQQIRLVDFGSMCRCECGRHLCLPTDLDQLPSARNALLGGTTAYAPPETLDKPSCSGDIWALGLTLLELLTGALVDESNASELVDLVQQGILKEFVESKPVRRTYDMILRSILIKEPHFRPTALELETELRNHSDILCTI